MMNEATYKVTEVHVHGAVCVERFPTLQAAIECADKLQAAYDESTLDGRYSYWIVTRDGWYPTTQVQRLHETESRRKVGVAC